jgi:serine/threonine-protein kinase
MTADGHLLFGLLALQTGMIRQEQLVAAFHAWTGDKSRPLADHLIALGHLNPAQRSAVEALAALHVDAHGGDAIRSLADVPAGRSTRDRLGELGDPDIESTLEQVSYVPAWSEDEDADRTGSFVVGAATSDGQRFRILRPHARGGLGAVLVALDGELNREVALKQILDHHADDPISRQRFLIEAQVTGGLEHPGIVPVYGLGTYADGRPYYAMRFIKGDSLKEVIERFHADASLAKDPGRRSLELRKLLRRFIDVCNAIDYAHSRGVLHRDIKPGNIIVGEHGETLVVDWGLAKATGKSDPGSGERALSPSAASGSAETLPGSALGTPAFMSPEQAGGDLEALGPRSDVYNLGATLYCLLTGHPPFKGESGEVLRAVQRGDFRPPRTIEPSIDRALEAVCLKALAFRPEDRYAQCWALAEDIERWMADEPVSAWREPISRRVRRWMQRNRTAVAAAGVALAAGVIGLGAVAGVQARANAAQRKANNETKAALAQAKEAKTAAEEALAQSEANARRAESISGALVQLVQRLNADPRLRAAGWTPLREELLRDVVAMYDELARRKPSEASLGLGQTLNNQALVQHLLGEFPKAVATQERGEAVLAALPPTYEVRLALANARKQLGVLNHFVGKPAEGLAKTRDAALLYQAVIRERPSDQNARFQLALATVNLGNFAMEREPDTAIARYREALTLISALRSQYPANPRYTEWEARTTSNLALVLTETGKIEDGIATQRRAVALAEQIADDFLRLDALAMCRNNLGEALEQAKRPAEAEAIFRSVLKDYRTLADRFPNDMDYRWGVAMASTSLADVVLQQDRPKDASELIEQAGKIFDDLEKPLGANPEFRQHHEKNKRVRDAIRQRLEAKSP